jgi:hypothetical protein
MINWLFLSLLFKILVAFPTQKKENSKVIATLKIMQTNIFIYSLNFAPKWTFLPTLRGNNLYKKYIII